MTLLVRLLLSHLLPLVVVTSALALPLVALYRMTATLESVGRAELGALRREGELHRVVWALDVSMRHAKDDCTAGRGPDTVRARIVDHIDRVHSTEDAIGEVTSRMEDVTRRYLRLGEAVVEDRPCMALLSEPIEVQRERLDEEMTNLWIARLDELHDQLSEKEEEVRSMGRVAIVAGAMLSVLALLFATFAAVYLTRAVNRPLQLLAGSARRVGRGDFETPVRAGGPPEFVTLAEELERMRLQLAELEALKQGFLASISHELRTPLSKVREALALLHDGVVGSLRTEQDEVVVIAQRACEREIRLVTTLLDLSRLRAGNPVRLRDGLLIDEILRRAIEDEHVDADAHGVHILLETSQEAPPCRLDSVLIERAVANLIRNAVAVSAEGQQVIVHRTLESRGEDDTVWVKISVRDSGPGIPPEVRSLIFDAFITYPVPNSPKGVGIGLGLSLAREVARAHGGTLEIDDSVTAGTVFHMCLPTNGEGL